MDASPDPRTQTRPAVEVADIFRRYGAAYRAQYPLSQQQRLVLRDITQCRTAALGGHVAACDECGGLRIAYNSCCNRHCPKCGTLAKAVWLDQQRAHLLPTHYFHVVFTIDHAFNPLARVNQKQVYDQLFHSAAETLKACGRQYLGGEIGFTAVLHTWGQTLTEHIHLHCLVPGGALSADGKRWQAASPDFLFPILSLSARFRDAFCAGLQQRYAKGQLHFAGQCAHLADPNAWQQLLAAAQAKRWQVYAKPPFGDAAQVLDYLGRYVRRIALSNHRLLDCADGDVRFTYRDYRDEGQQKVMTLPATEFIRRFLLHVLPKGFVRIRHYGLLASRYRAQKLARCRVLLGRYAHTPTGDRQVLLAAILGHPPDQCPFCRRGTLQRRHTLTPHPSRQRWVLAAVA